MNSYNPKQNTNLFIDKPILKNFFLSLDLQQYIHTYIYIYIYIFTYLISSSIHGTRKKEKKPAGTRDKSISNHHPGGKEKIL